MENEQNKITPIVFCADAGYGQYLPVAVQSIIENASSANKYHIIIFDCGIVPEDLAVLERQIAPHKNFSLKIESVSAFLQANSKAFRIKEGQHLSAATYARLFIPQLCGAYERVIYADIDMIFNRDLAELAAAPLRENYIAAAPDINIEFERRARAGIKNWTEQALGMAADDIYINAGLLLFNIPVWREKKLTEQCLALLADKPLKRHDQDAVNAVCKGKVYPLNLQWNCACVVHRAEEEQRQDGRDPYLQRLSAEQRAALASGTAVFHYVGAVKPWHNLAAEKGALWWAYARKTELYGRFSAAALAGESGLNIQTGKVEHRLFGLPVWRVKTYPKKKKWQLLGLPVAKMRLNPKSGEKLFYLLGLKLFSRKMR